MYTLLIHMIVHWADDTCSGYYVIDLSLSLSRWTSRQMQTDLILALVYGSRRFQQIVSKILDDRKLIKLSMVSMDAHTMLTIYIIVMVEKQSI